MIRNKLCKEGRLPTEGIALEFESWYCYMCWSFRWCMTLGAEVNESIIGLDLKSSQRAHYSRPRSQELSRCSAN
ncbi:hypothetical protein BABINDRAFT_163361 [Babjeviella inositovora NRRL Y-12698]|uniref:Uncharacterized protein n=1 Tax=Babjeviella inositovora NRRL Y-12698 TaxID=984486 RepID=A0A1E3QJK4_9ASCO|nr:uncharacterized protein BABINDRAFT_163361 [Babjeviella inositovora NRRL Y-12698]ODQ77644.1 hypothetical protein BABINDRAFT_163361 [Babjeviella inositovora NRRL Y-12698]